MLRGEAYTHVTLCVHRQKERDVLLLISRKRKKSLSSPFKVDNVGHNGQKAQRIVKDEVILAVAVGFFSIVIRRRV